MPVSERKKASSYNLKVVIARLAAAVVVVALGVEVKSLIQLCHPRSFSSNAAASRRKRAKIQSIKLVINDVKHVTYGKSLNISIYGNRVGAP